LSWRQAARREAEEAVREAARLEAAAARSLKEAQVRQLIIADAGIATSWQRTAEQVRPPVQLAAQCDMDETLVLSACGVSHTSLLEDTEQQGFQPVMSVFTTDLWMLVVAQLLAS
jgi:hypothetical protein